MALILKHELQCQQEGCTVIIHIDPQTAEFSKEFNCSCTPLESNSFIELIQCYIIENLPGINIKLVKIIVGTIVVSTVSFGGIIAGDDIVSSSTYEQTAHASTSTQSTTYTNYKVTYGDSLYLIAKRFNIAVSSIKSLNNLTIETINVDQILKIPTTTAPTSPSPVTRII
jgi:LysM repeat protein